MTCRSTILALSVFTLASAVAAPALAFDVPFGLGADGGPGSRPSQASTPAPDQPVRVAQASSDVITRLNNLEEQVRQLTGKVEDLRFQLLQAQEDMRKRQEDNEFRFQQLENGGQGQPAPQPSTQRRGDASPPAASSEQQHAAVAPATPSGGSDEIGQILDKGLNTNGLGGAAAGAPGGTAPSGNVAGMKPQDQGDLYDLAYNYLLAGDYTKAEDAFRQYAQTYPSASDVADAQYWLGESIYQQQRYADAAEVFLNAQKDHPDNDKAPEMMLKLGMSLAKLHNRETACVTYQEVERRYPKMKDSVARKLKAEEKAANC